MLRRGPSEAVSTDLAVRSHERSFKSAARCRFRTRALSAPQEQLSQQAVSFWALPPAPLQQGLFRCGPRSYSAEQWPWRLLPRGCSRKHARGLHL